MRNTTKTVCILLFVVALSLYGSTLIRLSQIQAPAAGLISSDGVNLGVTTVGSGLNLAAGVLSSTSGIPAFTVTNVSGSTPNSYPLSPGKTEALVFRNGMAQSATVDFNLVSGNVVFISPPIPGDVVLLACF